MSGKPSFSRGYDVSNECSDGLVHANGPAIIGTSLCGITDGLEGTVDPINCAACLAMIAFVHAHQKPKATKETGHD